MRTHGTQSRSMLCVVRNSLRSRFTPHCRWSKDVIYQMIRSNRKFDSHSREPRSWRTINYRMLVDHTTIMLRDSVSAMESHSPVCTITAVSKGPCSEADRISYDLSLATLSHELGVSFSRLRHDPPGSYSTIATPKMFVLRSMP